MTQDIGSERFFPQVLSRWPSLHTKFTTHHIDCIFFMIRAERKIVAFKYLNLLSTLCIGQANEPIPTLQRYIGLKLIHESSKGSLISYSWAREYVDELRSSTDQQSVVVILRKQAMWESQRRQQMLIQALGGFMRKKRKDVRLAEDDEKNIEEMVCLPIDSLLEDEQSPESRYLEATFRLLRNICAGGQRHAVTALTSLIAVPILLQCMANELLSPTLRALFCDLFRLVHLEPMSAPLLKPIKLTIKWGDLKLGGGKDAKPVPGKPNEPSSNSPQEFSIPSPLVPEAVSTDEPFFVSRLTSFGQRQLQLCRQGMQWVLKFRSERKAAKVRSDQELLALLSMSPEEDMRRRLIQSHVKRDSKVYAACAFVLQQWMLLNEYKPVTIQMVMATLKMSLRLLMMETLSNSFMAEFLPVIFCLLLLTEDGDINVEVVRCGFFAPSVSARFRMQVAAAMH